MGLVARPREFDTDAALDGAIGVFREHGFEGSSAQMLVDAMGIGRQSLYAAFGDKWQLYRSAVRRDGMGKCAAHFEALRSGVRAINGIDAMLRRVVETADQPGCCTSCSRMTFIAQAKAAVPQCSANLPNPHRFQNCLANSAAGFFPRRSCLVPAHS